ncbi:MAG: YopT-type cysteine protease domain-containing protein [Draconibacterium sp.]
MKLDDHVRTNNNLETTKGNYGVCISMTTRWIRSTKETGGVTRVWQIGNPGSFLVQQAAGMFGQQRGDENIILNSGLFIQSQHEDSVLSSLSTEGFHIISIWNTAGSVGHSMGTWVSGNTFQFFDPNFGLYHAENLFALTSDIISHCHFNYPDLTSRFIIRRVV